MKNPRVSRRKKILKIRAEINAKKKKKKNKERKIKSIKMEMKMERSQQTAQKYKGS